jgi:hypothetical protein
MKYCRLFIIGGALIGMLSHATPGFAQDVPASALTGLIHYSSLDNDSVGAGVGADTTADATFSVGASIGTAGIAGGSANTTPVVTSASHVTSGSSGQLSQALSFPAGENAGVQFASIAAPGLGDYSVSLWFNFQGAAQNGILAGSGNPGSSAEGWTIFYENGNLIFRMSVGGGGGDLRAAVNASVANDSSWHHAVLLIDSTAGVIKGYVDGVEATGTGSGGPPDETFITDGDGVANSDPTLLATRSSGGFQFLGDLDDFAVWNRALTAAEVTGVYDAGVAGNPLISKTDSDNDGMPNAYEDMFAFLDPNDPSDAALDEDLDTLSNLTECNQGTSPDDKDTDDDGLDDNEETTTNPLLADTDGDDLEDGPEVNTHMTDPNDSDSDDDNLSDGAEVNTHMTDPNDADSDNDTFDDGVEIAAGTLPNDDTSFPTVAVTDGLLVYYDFDAANTVGNSIADQAGDPAGPFDGTKMNGGPSSTAGLFAEAAEFLGGANNDAAEFVDMSTHAATLGALTEGSIAAWVKIQNDALVTDVLTIFAISDEFDGSSETRFWVSNGGGTGAGTLAYGVRDDGAGAGTTNTGATNPLIDGEWHHAAMTFSAIDSTAKLYIDGVEAASTTSAFFSGVDGANSASVGRNKDSAAGGGQWFFDGSMDDFAIWSRPLNPVEIAHIHSEGLAGNSLTSGDLDGFRITSIVHDPGAETVAITWASVPGADYELEWSPDLTSWESIDDTTATGTSAMLVDDFINRGKTVVFYRIIRTN